MRSSNSSGGWQAAETGGRWQVAVGGGVVVPWLSLVTGHSFSHLLRDAEVDQLQISCQGLSVSRILGLTELLIR